jgi:hypothetical protein
MTEKEKNVMDNLIDAWNNFLELESMHPDEKNDFKDGIHKCQYVLMARDYRRENK